MEPSAELSVATVRTSLIVTFADVTTTISPGSPATFGRASDSTIRLGVHDLHVHRRAGSFRWLAGFWELRNDGDISTIEVNIEGGLDARIAVGSHGLILPADAQGVARLLTPTPYTMTFVTPPLPISLSEIIDLSNNHEHDDKTVDPRTGLGLNHNEVKLLVALCEPRLRDPALPAFTIPSTKAICERLAISPKRVEDLIDSLVNKLARHVDGVIGTNDGRAVNRRQIIATFAIDTRCVTARDLRMLDSFH